MNNRPEPRPWSDIYDYDQSFDNLIAGDTYVDMFGYLRVYEGQGYIKATTNEGGEDLWLEFEHYIHRAAKGELPGLEDEGIAWVDQQI